MKLVAPHPDDTYKPKNGDILFDSGKYYLPFPEKEEKLLFSLKKSEYNTTPFILLGAMSENPWVALRELGIDYERFSKLAEYKCPYTKYTHFGVLPYLILAQDRDKYKTGRFDPKYSRYGHHAWDMEFLKDTYKERLFECEGIFSTLLGSGYTSCTRVGDGHGSRINVKVQIDNGDHLLCWAWEWYNK